MPMSGSGMKGLIKTKIEALPAFSGEGSIVFTRDDVLGAICDGIVEYIQTNAEVDSTGEVVDGAGAGGQVISTGDII